MAYSDVDGGIVLFGGITGLVPVLQEPRLDDTWLWDGTDWQEQFPAIVPPTRNNHAIAYDSIRDRMVLFGGESGPWAFESDDTWER